MNQLNSMTVVSPNSNSREWYVTTFPTLYPSGNLFRNTEMALKVIPWFAFLVFTNALYGRVSKTCFSKTERGRVGRELTFA